MNKIKSAFTSVLSLFFSATISAQSKATTQITAIRQKQDHVAISLTSSKPFIFGSNTYVLYVGDKQFTRNDQWRENEKGYMTFILSDNEYAGLQDAADMYLSYGEVAIEEEDMNSLAKSSRRCWKLGKLDKSKLLK